MILFQRRAFHFCWRILICYLIRENMGNESIWFSFLANSLGWLLGQSVIAGYGSGGELMPAIQMLTEIYFCVEWRFSASSDQLAILCCTSKHDSLSVPWPCWSFGPAAHIVCTSSSSLSQFTAICVCTINPLYWTSYSCFPCLFLVKDVHPEVF